MQSRDLLQYLDQEDSSLRREWQADPSSAIINSRSLIETTCKYILESRGESCQSKLPSLAKATLLNLSRWITDGTPESALLSIFDSCQNIICKIGALRDATSKAHGKSTKEPRTPDAHDARLIVSLTLALCYYLASLWSQTFIQKTGRELTADEMDTLIAILIDYRETKRIQGLDRLAYSHTLEELRSDFLKATGVRLELHDLFHTLIGIRKAGKLTKL